MFIHHLQESLPRASFSKRRLDSRCVASHRSPQIYPEHLEELMFKKTLCAAGVLFVAAGLCLAQQPLRASPK